MCSPMLSSMSLALFESASLLQVFQALSFGMCDVDGCLWCGIDKLLVGRVGLLQFELIASQPSNIIVCLNLSCKVGHSQIPTEIYSQPALHQDWCRQKFRSWQGFPSLLLGVGIPSVCHAVEKICIPIASVMWSTLVINCRTQSPPFI